MTISLTDRFRQCCRDLSREERAAVLKSIVELDRVLEDSHRHMGVGLRKLFPGGLWELRVGLSLRILFELKKEQATFVFLGSHDEVQRFLRGL